LNLKNLNPNLGFGSWSSGLNFRRARLWQK
jgi:hypothetical protein